MSPLAAIMVFGALMSVIALVGSMTLVLKEMTLRRILPLLVAFASGSLIGGAFFLMIPAAIENIGNTMEVFLWIAGGFLSSWRWSSCCSGTTATGARLSIHDPSVPCS